MKRAPKYINLCAASKRYGECSEVSGTMKVCTLPQECEYQRKRYVVNKVVTGAKA